MAFGGQRNLLGRIPNWRERLVCPNCQMNNRQRLIASLIMQELSNHQRKKVYFMEQITPIFNWALINFVQHQLIGSEYLGHEYISGTYVKGVRHEDAENLSFPDRQLDLIVSNDVFEHVPNPSKAFSECVRSLKLGSTLITTIPFFAERNNSVARARLQNGKLENILPAEFHGNPISDDGSLVFTDFGWDILQKMRDAGFSSVMVEVYASSEFAHLGGGQLIFRCKK